MHDQAPSGHRHTLAVERLSATAFAPFGDVIETSADAQHHGINQGFAERYHDLAQLDTGEAGGRPLLNIFRALPRALPLRLAEVERHRLGSQAFMPLAPLRFLVVVAAAGLPPRADQLRCFMAASGQGVNYARGTWHHPLLAIDAGGDFLVIDRGGPGAADDCEVHRFGPTEVWVHG
jgi:ureidoglycolate lyase